MIGVAQYEARANLENPEDATVAAADRDNKPTNVLLGHHPPARIVRSAGIIMLLCWHIFPDLWD